MQRGNVKEVIELLMDSMNQGIIFVDSEEKIQLCNRKAKETTGIIINAKTGHDAGKICEGDIVVIADNKLGDDDGLMSREELTLLNINDSGIEKGDMLVAVGVYKNKKIEPQYKYIREHSLNVPMKLDVNYWGFHISAVIDTGKKETLISVNDMTHRLRYSNAVGNVVIIDGTTGDIKFFQAKGYSVRQEDLGYLLRGAPYQAKTAEDTDVDVTGQRFLDLFQQSPLTEKLRLVLEGREEKIHNQLYEINKRPFNCSIVRCADEAGTGGDGAFLLLQDASHLESLLSERDQIIQRIEEQNTAREVKYLAWKAAKSRFNVIITGESGTGKSKLAREIHSIGMKDAPFIEVNCNAIAPTLFESELFGYVGGCIYRGKERRQNRLFRGS